MSEKVARADVAQLRQTTQFTCCATSITSALHALGKPFTEDDVNKVLGAAPMAGATWEAMLATVQYFGCRGTLVVPCTPRMLKAWTDRGIPVVIAWNPEGRPWSHASTVFDVKEGEDGKLTVYIMDSNIPNPDETTRVMDADTFCQKWGEKVSDTLIVRRPAMAIEREVSVEGRQVVASTHPVASSAKRAMLPSGHPNKYYFTVLGEGRDPYHAVAKNLPAILKREGWTSVEVHDENSYEHDEYRSDEPAPMPRWRSSASKVAETYLSAKGMQDVKPDTRTPGVVTIKEKPRDLGRSEYGPGFVTDIMRHPGNGAHGNRDREVGTGRSRKPKHKQNWSDREADEPTRND